MKRFALCALCALMLLSLLAGCGQEEDGVVTYDWEAAFGTYPAETTVMTVNGRDVSWELYFYWLYSGYMKYLGGYALEENVPDDTEMTVAEFLLSDVEYCCAQYKVLEDLAEKNSAELTEADMEVLELQLQDDIAEYVGEDGTEAEFYEYLEGIYTSPELYEYINRMMVLFPRLFITINGETGEKFSDEEALAFAEEYGCMKVKHILFSAAGEDGAELSEEEKADKLAAAQAVLDELNAVPEAGREARFTEIMNEKSEDPGLAQYPEGYCFMPGVMQEAFEAAAAELQPGELSGIVETPNGYHILLGVEISPDDVPLMNSEVQYTVRYAAAVTNFNYMYNEAVNTAEVVYSPEFENLDLSAVLREK